MLLPHDVVLIGLFLLQSHAQRHPPGPITREKLEAKELEDSKRNLTALVRSDKKTEIKKSEVCVKKFRISANYQVSVC